MIKYKRFKFYLSMQGIAIKYIIITFSSNFIWLKPYSIKKFEKFKKDNFLTTITSDLFVLWELKFLTPKGKKLAKSLY